MYSTTTTTTTDVTGVLELRLLKVYKCIFSIASGVDFLVVKLQPPIETFQHQTKTFRIYKNS